MLTPHSRSVTGFVAGDVKHAEVFADFNGRSKGCGIVEYSNPEDAQRAIAELNDTELEGRKIFVREVSALCVFSRAREV